MENNWICREQQMPEANKSIEFKNFEMDDDSIMQGWSDGIAQFFQDLGRGYSCYEKKAYLWRYIQPERSKREDSHTPQCIPVILHDCCRSDCFKDGKCTVDKVYEMRYSDLYTIR